MTTTSSASQHRQVGTTLRDPHITSYVLLIQELKGTRAVVLESHLCTVGRRQENTICINNNFVSRNHAYLVRVALPDQAGYTYTLYDGDIDNQFKPSVNGVFVNGKRIRQHTLEPGDVIHFGPAIQAIFYPVKEGAESSIFADINTEQVHPLEIPVNTEVG
ncbi:MAG: hypothetical protein OHK0012_10020 [Synechococcales cyanobacterium]